MRKVAKALLTSTSVATLTLCLAAGSVFAASTIDEGKKLAFDRKKGNCLACHFIEGGDSPGDIGPPLVAMKARYPDKAKLRGQVWDATVANPESIMPPFGRYKVLSEAELDKVIEFIHSL